MPLIDEARLLGVIGQGQGGATDEGESPGPALPVPSRVEGSADGASVVEGQLSLPLD